MDSELEISPRRIICLQYLGNGVVDMSFGIAGLSCYEMVECVNLSTRWNQNTRMDVLEERRHRQSATESRIHHLHYVCIKFHWDSLCENSPLSILLLVFLFSAHVALDDHFVPRIRGKLDQNVFPLGSECSRNIWR
mmetsp:Transcript_21235/g.45359  ORF Transcript_21235/g.45359 Transcript_21235/m.45359 type:complete len:136 (-) Transcript_21235:1658-2065(-)